MAPVDAPETAAPTPRLTGVVLPVPKPPARIGPFRWALWSFDIALALLVFYGLFSFFWVGLRLVATVAELRSRRRKA
jgi:hypothetical protein